MKYYEFPIGEMNQKLANARELMAKAKMKGLVVTAAANHFYFTGFRMLANWASFTRTVFVFIPLEKEPVLYVQEFAKSEAIAKSAYPDVRTFKEIMSAPIGGIVEIMKELGMDSGKVGFELGYEQRMDMSFRDYEAVKASLPDTDFVDASDLIWRLRMIKLPFEIECMRESNRITSRAFDRCYREIHEGMTEKEVAQKFVAILAEEGSELPGFVIVISGPGNYDRISARPTDKKLHRGDFVWIDAGANYKGYFADFCRAGVVGGGTAEQRRLQSVVHEATLKACQAVASGVAMEDLYNICAQEFLAHQLPWSFECGRAGHGIGLQLTEPPSVAKCDRTLLQPGMVITLEPGHVNELGCFDVEENILVTETGYEILSGGSRELHDIATA